MNQIALDMHLIREVGPLLKGAFNLNTDVVGITDTWGAGFVDELDYVDEALHAKSFTESIGGTPLSGTSASGGVGARATSRPCPDCRGRRRSVDGERGVSRKDAVEGGHGSSAGEAPTNGQPLVNATLPHRQQDAATPRAMQQPNQS